MSRKILYVYRLSAFLLPFVCGLVFTIYTNHSWEDFYITYRSSKNLATGQGLVYDPGERVHSFTSPIGVLLPAAIKYITDASDEVVLWIFRAVGCIMLGFTGLLLLGIARQLRLSAWPIIFLLTMFSFDAKSLDFSTNGMETAFLIFFIALTAHALVVPLRRPALVIGAAWAGLMWTRPDGFVYILGLSLGCMVFRGAAIIGDDRPGLLRTFMAASGMAAILYVPWVVWSWGYYGSFVPYSASAKAVGYVYDPWWIAKGLITFPLISLTRGNYLDEVFRPTYAVFGGWPLILADISRFISWICCFAWLLPLRPAVRAISLATLVVILYFTYGIPSAWPWYYPGATLLCVMVLALVLDEFVAANRLRAAADDLSSAIPPGPKRLASVLALTLMASTLLITICAAYQARIDQKVICEHHLKQIGLWLHEHAAARDAVFLEPFGYIGFYSNLKVYGGFGQSSPELVAARRAHHCSFQDCWPALIEDLKPEWLVLRAYEVANIRKEDPALLVDKYTLKETFDVGSELASYRFLPGRQMLEISQKFLVFHRNVPVSNDFWTN